MDGELLRNPTVIISVLSFWSPRMICGLALHAKSAATLNKIPDKMSDQPYEVNLTNCDKEPIHTPGSIQPHGAMLVCTPGDGIICFASANAKTFLRLRDELIGRTLSDAVGDDAAHNLRNAAARAGGSHIAGALMACQLPTINSPCDLTIHSHNDFLFVEADHQTWSLSLPV